MRAEYIGHRSAFCFVVCSSASAVSVDIAHVLSIDLCVAQGTRDGARCTLLAWHYDISGVGAHGITDHFAKNIRATGLRVFIFLKNKDTCAFPLHHAVTVGAKGAARIFGHDAQAFPGLHAAKTEHRFRTTSDHRGAHPTAHHLKGLRHCMI